ncbi:MAG: IS200/IS605 family transposase [Pseudomonadota bacterium]|nr:IS200/IS605 family transposase [Pseudomonadota bacterium]
MVQYAAKYNSNKSVVYSCIYHVIWCPKYRRPVLLDAVATRLESIIQSVCNEHDIQLIEMEIMPDHVHLLANVAPQFGIHKLVKTIKGRSSRIIRSEFPSIKSRLPTLWTNSYFVVTTGGAPLEIIKQYIEQQKRV